MGFTVIFPNMHTSYTDHAHHSPTLATAPTPSSQLSSHSLGNLLLSFYKLVMT